MAGKSGQTKNVIKFNKPAQRMLIVVISGHTVLKLHLPHIGLGVQGKNWTQFRTQQHTNTILNLEYIQDWRNIRELTKS